MLKIQNLRLIFRPFFLLLSCPFFLLANPEGAEIEAGNALISAHGKELTIIQDSEKAIINWEKFSIQKGETTEFILPSSSSATLNRVDGGALSEIYGTLKSNGELLLINSQGVMIGPNGIVDVCGFIASTYDLKNEEFFHNKGLNFQDTHNSGSSIINQGQITATGGDIILLAKDVDNQGQLKAPQGETHLKGGCEVMLLPNEKNKITVRLKKTGSVKNSGTIKTIKAEIEACGGSAECLAVSNEGVIEALGIGEKDGKLVLLSDETISNSGTLTAKNTSGTGGKLHLLGDEVQLEKGALVDASGENGGGEVLIGGDYQGKNPLIKNASYVYMDKEAEVHADSLENGDGGKVILWSEKATDWRGLTTAKGGTKSGDGGFIEVSSKDFLNPKGRVDTLALNGQAGTFLLDPYNITISGAATGNGAFGGGNPNTFTPSGSPCTLLNTDLQTALGGANVIVTTSGGGAEDGDITISAAVNDAGGNNLTLTADGGIAVSSNLTITGNLAFNVNQGGSGGVLTFGTGTTITSASTSVAGNTVGTSVVEFGSPRSAITVTMNGAYAGSISGGVTVDSFANIQSVTAPTSVTNTLIGPAGGKSFNITGVDQGNITGVLSSFTNFSTLKGGSGDDTFVFESTSSALTGALYGEGGSNTLDCSSITGSGADWNNGMQLTGADTGLVAISSSWPFYNIGNFNGSSTSIVILNTPAASLSGSVNLVSGLRSTIYWYLWGATSVTVNMEKNAATGIYGGQDNGFSNITLFGAIEDFQFTHNPKLLKNANSNNTIIGFDDDKEYILRGYNSFGIFNNSSVAEIAWVGFPTLIGGNGNDTFKVNYAVDDVDFIMNVINGGGGINTLDLNTVDTSATISFGDNRDGSVAGLINYFNNTDIVILPGGEIYNLNRITSIVSILTEPDIKEIDKSENKGINLTQGSIPSFEAGIRFIVNDALGQGEIRLTNATFRSKNIIPQLLAKNYNFYEDLLPEIKIRNSTKKEENSD